MAKKVAKPKRAPLKPTTAWAVVVSKTGRIPAGADAESATGERMHIYRSRRKASRPQLLCERVVKVRITEA